jgi:hypothetical protein
MRILPLFFIIVLVSCNSNNSSQEKPGSHTPIPNPNKQDTAKKPPSAPVSKVYSNERFKDVTISNKGLSDHEFLVKGKAQIFEASFGWVIEDGHNELQSGHEMTDAGAPEWGNFNFKIKAVPTPNKTLHLILFETSAKDGTRQYNLPIPLYERP